MENNDLILISTSTVNNNNGSYTVTKLYKASNTAKDTTYNTYGIKDVTHYESDDSITWQYTLTGYFTVTSGVSSVCTNATYSQYINASGWYFSNGSATYSGNTAYGAGTYKYKILFITIQTIEIDISISCDIYGNLT